MQQKAKLEMPSMRGGPGTIVGLKMKGVRCQGNGDHRAPTSGNWTLSTTWNEFASGIFHRASREDPRLAEPRLQTWEALSQGASGAPLCWDFCPTVRSYMGVSSKYFSFIIVIDFKIFLILIEVVNTGGYTNSTEGWEEEQLSQVL